MSDKIRVRKMTCTTARPDGGTYIAYDDG